MARKLDASLASDLWFFRVAAEQRSMKQAASELALTQSAVTQRIHRLEERLAIRLFNRTNKGIHLTEAGAMLYADLSKGFDLIATALTNASNVAAYGRVTVNCVPSLALEWLAPRLSDFTEANPNITVTLLADMTMLDTTQMSMGGIDVAIRYSPTPPSRVQVIAEFQEWLYPVATRDYIERYQANPEERITLIHDADPWTDTPSKVAEWIMWIEANGRPWGRRTRNTYFNMAYLAYQAASGGNGLAMGRHLLVNAYIRNGRMIALPGHEPMPGPRYFVLKRPAENRDDIDIFVAWLIEQMQGVAPPDKPSVY
ncbi:LysR substrate-binding domain-containing protein [Devosia ginsengisoli]|uniref:LysR substrate-binding domain-containing protein n=1 Tax=Devosia ginsengisoli TaxID=400770 RepID=UPI001647CBEF|nr:LysR substrate-binding domain-containing protein [Devosia ginsengisoli]